MRVYGAREGWAITTTTGSLKLGFSRQVRTEPWNVVTVTLLYVVCAKSPPPLLSPITSIPVSVLRAGRF